MFESRHTLRSLTLAIASSLLVLASSTILFVHRAHAQPGQSPDPGQQPLPPSRYPEAAPYRPAHAYSNYYLLTAQERELLLEGEISTTQTLGGGALSLWLGFGIGHAVQGRYGSVGWKFTVGQAASFAGILVGAHMALRDGYNNGRAQTRGENVILVSTIAYAVLRVWDAIDAFTGPGQHNAKVRAARWKASGASNYNFFAGPSEDQKGGVAGLALRF